jgi:hypothetical protein
VWTFELEHPAAITIARTTLIRPRYYARAGNSRHLTVRTQGKRSFAT